MITILFNRCVGRNLGVVRPGGLIHIHTLYTNTHKVTNYTEWIRYDNIMNIDLINNKLFGLKHTVIILYCFRVQDNSKIIV